MSLIKKLLIGLLVLGLTTNALAYDPNAKQIKTDVSNFDSILSASDTDVQKALETLNDLSETGALAINAVAGAYTALSVTAVHSSSYVLMLSSGGGYGGTTLGVFAGDGLYGIPGNYYFYLGNGIGVGGILTLSGPKGVGINADDTVAIPAGLYVNNIDASLPVSIFRGATSQSGDLARWTNSTPTILAKIDASGNISATNLSGTNTGDQTSLPISASPTTQTGQGIIVSMTYGESITLGDLLYFKSDSKVYKADANAAGLYPVMGLALATASSGANNVLLMGTYKDSTKWTGGSVLTVGGVCYLSITVGGTTQAQPTATDDVIQVIGTAIATDTINFNPSPDYATHI